MANIIPLDDLHDARLARYRDLRGDPVDSLESGSFIVEGRWCLQRLAQSSHTIRSVLVQQGHEAVPVECVDSKTPIYTLPRDQMRALVGYDFHRGMLACGVRPAMKSVDHLQPDGSRPKIALAVLGVTEKENLGSMLRSAAALGVRDILIGPNTADPYSRRTVRVSMATILHQTLYELSEPVTQLTHLSTKQGFRTLVTTLSDAQPLDQFVHDDRPMVLIVGSEAGGVGEEIEAIATDRLTIPMKLGTDSLNVAVATAIFLYQLSLNH